jgi:hypothetical protein
MNLKRVKPDRSPDAIAPEGPRRRRTFWRISLGGMCVLLTVLATGMGWLSMKAAHARRQRAVVEALGATGFEYDFQRSYGPENISLRQCDRTAQPPGSATIRWLFGDYVFANIVGLDLSEGGGNQIKLNPATLAELAALGTLENLSLNDQPVGDTDLEFLRHLPSLKRLILSGTKISDETLRTLAGMRQLEELNLSYTNISGVGLAHLRDCLRLKELWIRDVPLTPEGGRAIANVAPLEVLYGGMNRYKIRRGPIVGDEVFEGCAKLQHLRWICVDGRPLTDVGLRHLREIPRLETLYAEGTEITDEGLAHIAVMPSLACLHIRANEITDAGLAHLRHATRLEVLDLGRNRITDDGVRQLRRLNKLTELYLDGTLITDQSLALLKDLPSLDCCHTSNTAVTPAGRAQVVAERPQLTVH